MKAKVIKTGEIVDVYHEPQHGQITNIYKESVLVNGRMWTEDELDFCIKANEAPEKLYVDINDNLSDSILYGFTEKRTDEDIEYIRTDVFIDKALKWYCLDCECNDNCKNPKCFFYEQYERYLNGETNAIPPKFSDRIINENGSVSEKYRYRHFINRMQDAFIEKACEYWYQYNQNIVKKHGVKEVLGCSEFTVNVEDFKNYLKGE